MSSESKEPASPSKPSSADDGDERPSRDGSRADRADGRARKARAPVEEPLALDERRLTYEELERRRAEIDRSELAEFARDGRALVRANAALALAATGQSSPLLIPLLRDSDIQVARAGAEAIERLGPLARPLIPQVALALDGTQPEVTDRVLAAFAALVGSADDEMIEALDVPLPLALKSIVEACALAPARGVAFLMKAAADPRSRIRINAVAGLAQLGTEDLDAAIPLLAGLEERDPVPDVRMAARKSLLAILPRGQQETGGSLPRNIPDFELRKLSSSELAEYADATDVDELIHALRDGRDHVRVNGARCLAQQGARAGRAARAMTLLLRDSAVQVRREVARALGALGDGALAAAPELVSALGDADEDVADAAGEALARLGEPAMDALVRGMDVGEAHGRRVVQLIGLLPAASPELTRAFRDPAVNVQVNAAIGLGLLGGARVGAGLPALLGARTGGDPRTREAVRRALAMLDAEGRTRPAAVAIDGFEERLLGATELDAHRAALEAYGVPALAAALQDGRDVVRANAATGLGALGTSAASAARPLGVLLRDDAARVRLAAVRALDRIGDAAVLETADDLVRALASQDAGVCEACAAVLRARKGRMVAALVRGLETDQPAHGRRILEVIAALPDASEILVDAFASPAVNVQVNAAVGLGMLGDRVGPGRRALDGARTGRDVRVREAVFQAIERLDGPRSTGPGTVEVEGFETRLLEPDAFAGAAAQLSLADLVAYAQDGRPVVRANAATAIGSLGPAGAGSAQSLGVLLRDDDMRVRVRAAQALDRLGDDAVRAVAGFLVGALRGDADVARACAAVLGARRARVLGALVGGLETDDPVHARRILELIGALPDACEVLCDAFESAAENVQVNAAIGIGMLGARRAGSAGRKALEGARTGGFARTREAVFKALAMLDNPEGGA